MAKDMSKRSVREKAPLPIPEPSDMGVPEDEDAVQKDKEAGLERAHLEKGDGKKPEK